MSKIRSTAPPERKGMRKAIYLLPNLITASNMVLGILSIITAVNDSLTLSLAAETNTTPFVLPAKLILAAIFLDFMDGRVARATNTTSKFGVEFDSLSDLVSFGMAPAILIYLSVLRYMDGFGIFVMLTYIVCAAVRLARFNVQSQVEEKDSFMGLPSPAAAGILASYILLAHWGGWYGKGIGVDKIMGWYEENLNFVEYIVIPALTLTVAGVMVSFIRYPSLKKLKTERIKPLTLVVLVLSVFLLFYAYELTSFLILAFYLIWGLFRAFARNTFGRLRRPRTATS